MRGLLSLLLMVAKPDTQKSKQDDQWFCPWNIESRPVTDVLSHALNETITGHYTVKEIITYTDRFRRNTIHDYQDPGTNQVRIYFSLAPADGCDWTMKCGCEPRKKENGTSCWVNGSFRYVKPNIMNFNMTCDEGIEMRNVDESGDGSTEDESSGCSGDDTTTVKVTEKRSGSGEIEDEFDVDKVLEKTSIEEPNPKAEVVQEELLVID